MTAYELYEAVFDIAREEFWGQNHEDRLEDVIGYADGAFNITVAHEAAEAIVNAHESFAGLDEDNGEYENAFWHKVKKPLSQIELA
ncbi:hypothetical protein [Algiphilus sp.]|uniref:hypothetical protein n=1 Tax=Algiphilus sp. TaxID=1872431 RepID=UPI003CCBA1EB